MVAQRSQLLGRSQRPWMKTTGVRPLALAWSTWSAVMRETVSIIATLLSSTNPGSFGSTLHVRGRGCRRLRRLGRPELDDHDARVEPLGLSEVQDPPGVALSEETFARPEDDRVHHEAVEIDQVLLHQRIEDLPAAGEQQVVAGLSLQPANLLRQIPFDQLRTRPFHLAQRRRDHVLGHGVHLFAELASPFHVWPGGREPFVGLAPEQQRVAGLQLSPLELPCLVIEEGAGPATGLLEHTIEREVFGGDQ